MMYISGTDGEEK